MTGPLDVLFAQVRETLECPNQDAPMHTRTGCTYCSATADAFAALSSIERHVQDMEKALRGIRDADGLCDGCGDNGRAEFEADVDVVLANPEDFRPGCVACAALPAREKEEE